MIHQINITVEDEKDSVDGCSNINIENLPQITNGFVKNITFTTLDKIPQNERNPIFIETLKKLSRGGSLTIRFLNPENICHKIQFGTFSGEQFAALATNIRSSWTNSDFLSLIYSIPGFDVIKNMQDDVYSIAVIEKTNER